MCVTEDQILQLSAYGGIGSILEHQARARENDVWMIYEPDDSGHIVYSYRNFRNAVICCRSLLLNKGLRRGDRVATVAHNHADTVIQYFAAWSLGLAIVPLNIGEDDRMLSYILSDADVSLVFVRSEYMGRLQKIATDIPSPIPVVEVSNEWSVQLHEALEEARGAVESEKGLLDQDALIVYTSGTTGMPKGVVLSQRNLIHDAVSIAQWHGIDETARMMCVLPIHHVNGTVVTLLAPFISGSSTVLLRKFHTHSFFETINKHAVTIVSVVPTLLQYLVHDTSLENEGQSSTLHHIICGAGPLTCDLARSFERKFGIPIIHGYGLSETTCYSSFLPLDLGEGEHDYWMQYFGFPSIGVPLPINDMDIQDDDGRSLGEGVKGEIVIRGGNVMQHYFKNPSANAAAFTHGWFRSGDEGFYQRDSEGRRYFFITGRYKELIIRGGVNISPLEIDEVLASCPGVHTGIAVGFENAWYGEEVGALVIRSTPQVTATDIMTHCKSLLPYSKCPKVVLFADTLPVTSTGKYQRTRVRGLFAEWRDIQFR